MAISYSLYMATPSSSTQVARELHDSTRIMGLFDASVTPEQLLDEGAVTRLGTWIRAREIKLPSWNVVVADLGITATVSIVFRFNKHDKLSEQDDDMIRLVSSLLDRITGDAVLTDFDDIWLLRRGGDLTVSEQEDLWPPHRLAALSLPYRRATQTFSED